MRTDKSKKKNKYDLRKALIVTHIAGKTGYTTAYIRACLIGTHNNETSTEVKRKYNTLRIELDKLLK